jgi:hypothetical protein
MRPIVLVYQEFAAVSTTPDTPDLNALLVGPAYWIKDYLDDKGDIQTASDYGTKDSDNPYIPPLAGTDAITIADPPGNKTGALLDATSVHVYFDEARVEISKDVAVGASVTANSNIVTGAGGTTFLADGVKAGDYIVVQDPANPGVLPDLVKRVLYVDTELQLRTTTNFDTSATVLYRVEREVTDVLIDDSFVTVSGNTIIIAGGVTTLLTGELVARTVNYAKVYVEYRALRQDLRGTIDTVSSTTDVTTKIGKIDSRNPLAGTAYAALQNTTTPIQFYGLSAESLIGHSECQDLIEARKDIYAIVPLTESLSIIAAWKTNVEALASVDTAIATGRPQKFRVILGAQALPTTKVISGPYTAGAHLTVTAAIPGTPITTADAINVFADAGADFVTAGVRAGDLLVIVSDTAGTPRLGTYPVAAVYDAKRLRTTTVFPAVDNAGSVRYYIIRGTGTPETVLPATWSVAGATTTPNTITTDINRSAGVADEYQGKVVHLGGGLTTTHLVTASTAANPAVLTAFPNFASQAGVSGTVVNPLMAVTTARVIATRRCFRVIRDNAASFSTDLVIAGDTLQVPNPLSGSDYTTPYEYTVAYVPNENVTVLDANEDVIATDVETGDVNLRFRVSRTLTKNDQIDELVTISQSINSRRVVLVWPDEIEVTDLVDGSKARAVASTAELADAQPGYYLAAIVGALTAGLPSHQGFSNLGIAAVDKINHSTRYFSDSQLTELSDGGWFVYDQETENALPVCIHQLTTDPDTLESGEYSLVKNFDFISIFFQDILDDYLGQYNINEETLGFLQQALNTGIDVLKLRRFAKIGAPLISASVTFITQSTAAADRAEVYMDVKMPKPLNVIGLHLVSQ